MTRKILYTLSAFAFLATASLRAEFTVDLQVGPIDDTAARGFLVADVNGDGFSGTGPWIAGTQLSPGETLGASDDLILAVFGSTSALPWPSGTGFGSVLSGLNGAAEGVALAVYWIPGSNDGPADISDGSRVSRIIDSSFAVPADGATVKVVALSTELGGSVDPGDVENGATISGDTPELSLNTPTSVNLDAGETTFFLFQTQTGDGLSLNLEGGESVSGQVFDLAGNQVESLAGGELNLPGGVYYLALTETSGTDAASFDATLISSEYQPDLWIAGKQKRARRNNVYSSNPRRQKYRMEMYRRYSYPLVLENDSFLPDSLRLTASRMRPPFRQKVVEPGRGNVISQITTGSYSSGELEGRTSRVLKVTVIAKRSSRSKRRYRATQNFFAHSTSDPVKRDSVCVKVLSKK